METTKWNCERCKKEFDLEVGEGWVSLAEEIPSPEDGKLNSLEPYEVVCYACADELYTIVEKCDQNCLSCEATTAWGLSIRDCLQFQLKFDLLTLPKPKGKVPFMGSLYEAGELKRMFRKS
jgi:hypothetical protein